MKIYSIFFLLFFFLISGTADNYSQTIQSDFKALSEGADLIITGKVSGQKSQWNADKTMITTLVTINVDEYYKGQSQGSNIVVAHPGGEVDNIGELYSHIPTFKLNEEVLLFLKKHDSDMSYRVFEGESGKLSLHTDAVTGDKITSRNTKLSELKKEIKSFLNRE